MLGFSCDTDTIPYPDKITFLIHRIPVHTQLPPLSGISHINHSCHRYILARRHPDLLCCSFETSLDVLGGEDIFSAFIGVLLGPCDIRREVLFEELRVMAMGLSCSVDSSELCD